ncbi:O-antigen ligase family protein [Vibrio coralliilyticus]|uniref:O-antigen ligase family protein n=1 Tax=Vibrio coralliilyticus TaxID=190893 RepID=UPI0005FA9463|nr:O-antigen ligase family protein [Vibrio coralliilyticus]QOU29767.1 O-antigen ligase family protein [Vibrio coralliilyticus]
MTIFNNTQHLDKFTSLSIFLVLGLLLSTENFSVVIAAITSAISLILLFKYRSKIEWSKEDKIFILCLSAYFISNIPMAISDLGNFRYFRGASRLVLCIPIYFYFKYLIETDRLYSKPLIFGVILGSTGAFILACYQFFIEGRPRVDGFLYSINFGYLACTLAVMSLSLMTFKKHRTLLFIGFILSSSAMMMTLTRGAIIALPLVVLSIIALEYTRFGFLKSATALVLIVLISISLYNTTAPFKNRVDFTVTEINNILSGDISKAVSSGGRLMLWKASVEAFKESPITGLTYPERMVLNKKLAEDRAINQWTANVKRGHAHSQYFEQLASGGILGVFAIFFTVFFPMIYFFYHRKTSKAAYVGTFFVLTIAICCLTEVALQQNLISTYYGYMLALLFAVTQLEVEKHRQEVTNVYSSS